MASKRKATARTGQFPGELFKESTIRVERDSMLDEPTIEVKGHYYQPEHWILTTRHDDSGFKAILNNAKTGKTFEIPDRVILKMVDHVGDLKAMRRQERAARGAENRRRRMDGLEVIEGGAL